MKFLVFFLVGALSVATIHSAPIASENTDSQAHGASSSLAHIFKRLQDSAHSADDTDHETEADEKEDTHMDNLGLKHETKVDEKEETHVDNLELNHDAKTDNKKVTPVFALGLKHEDKSEEHKPSGHQAHIVKEATDKHAARRAEASEHSVEHPELKNDEHHDETVDESADQHHETPEHRLDTHHDGNLEKQIGESHDETAHHSETGEQNEESTGEHHEELAHHSEGGEHNDEAADELHEQLSHHSEGGQQDEEAAGKHTEQVNLHHNIHATENEETEHPLHAAVAVHHDEDTPEPPKVINKRKTEDRDDHIEPF